MFSIFLSADQFVFDMITLVDLAENFLRSANVSIAILLLLCVLIQHNTNKK